MTNTKIKTVGGSPTASHFFLRRQDNEVSAETNLQVMSEPKSNQKEGDPGLPPLRGSLRCSTAQAAAELALRAQTILADTP